MTTPIIVICSCDDNYAPYCGTMITSLFHNNLNHKIEVNILSSYISKNNEDKFKCLADNYGQVINIVSIDKNKFKNLPLGRNFTNISIETYFRLNMLSLFPQYDKVLYLDCDMIIRHDLEELWKIDLTGYAIAAVKDNLYMQQKNIIRLGYESKHSYYNSGMGLYNLSFLRDFNFENKIWDFVEKHYNKILYHDQDIINALCHGYFKEISVRWNMLDVFLMEDSHIVNENKKDLEKWIENPGIIHYSAKYKPWNIEGYHQYREEFWKYVKISPWNDLKATRKFYGKERVVIKLKLAIKNLLGMIGCKKYSYRKLSLK